MSERILQNTNLFNNNMEAFMTVTTQYLYRFLLTCAGNWRNTVYIPENGLGYLLSTDRDGRPVVMAADHFQKLTGEQIDPTECIDQLTEEGFKALYSQYLLWHLPSDSDDPLAQLCQA